MSADFHVRMGERRRELKIASRPLAEEMRSLGHTWHHTTVWQVETGKRPLKLVEAVDLARILEIAVVPQDDGAAAELTRLYEAVTELTRRVDELNQALKRERTDNDTALRQIAAVAADQLRRDAP